jgi:phosphopantetheinyl transferase
MLDCASTAFDEAAARALLDGAEAERLAAFRLDARRREYLAGRLMAKSIVSSLLGIEPSAVEISVGENGKPRPPAGLELGIAHSGGLALAAVAASPAGRATASGLGLDLERLRPRPNLDAVAEYAFSASELAQLARSPGGRRELAFHVLWTLKEAWLKRSGEGISALGRAPAFELGPDGALGLIQTDPTIGDRGEFLCLGFGSSGPEGTPAYVAALATGASKPALDIEPAELEVVFDERFAPPAGMAVRTLFATARAARLSAR